MSWGKGDLPGLFEAILSLREAVTPIGHPSMGREPLPDC